MRIGANIAGVAAWLAGAFASLVLVTVAVGDTWKIKTVIPAPGKGLVSYDFTWVDPVLGYYFLADRTNKAVDVFNTATNTLNMLAGVTPAGQSVFKGNVPGGVAGPNGVFTVRGREIWASDGDSTVKVLSMATGQLMTTIYTGGQFRVDGICYD